MTEHPLHDAFARQFGAPPDVLVRSPGRVNLIGEPTDYNDSWVFPAAIVHPDDVLSYISPQECQISYNPLLMALLWEALATREVKLIDHSMRTRFKLPQGCAWINYLRSHDDIGWTFDDNDAHWEWIDPVGHRQFLNQFYIGRYEGSFARGVPFQENPDTGDARVSGTLASLAGLEQALQSGDETQIDLAVRRILRYRWRTLAQRHAGLFGVIFGALIALCAS
jgi:hypothetical protein